MGSQPLPSCPVIGQLSRSLAQRMTAPGETSLFRRTVSALSVYVDSSDPLVRANNVLALLVASNQPFYPFYVRFMAGDDGGASFITLLSTPFFVAVPTLARLSRSAALAAVPVIGLVNGMFATKALGAAAGIELFAIPCMLVALLGSDRRSWAIVMSAAVAALAVYAAVYATTDGSWAGFGAVAHSSVYRLHLVSIVFLSLYIVYALGAARRARLDATG